MGSKDAITLLNHVRDNLNEPLAAASMTDLAAGSTYTNSFLLECLNKAKDRTWTLIRRNNENYFQTSSTITLNSNTKEYSLASDFRQLIGMKITTSSYEYFRIRYADQATKEFQWRDSIPAGNTTYLDELIYDIVGQTTLKFADFPPMSLTLAYDYIQYLADFTLSAASTVNINDEIAEYIEAYTTWKAVLKNPADARLKIWESEIERLEPTVLASTSKRNLRETEYVEPY